MRLALILLPLFTLTARADDESLMTIHRIETETADRIQARVLDPILGPGLSSVFVKLKLEVTRTHESSDHVGEGQAKKFTVKNELSISTAAKAKDLEYDLFGGFGFTDSVKPPYQATSSQKQAQESRQTKSVKEERIGMRTYHKEFRLIILHDARVPQSKLSGVRSALLAICAPEHPKIDFHPVEFSALK